MDRSERASTNIKPSLASNHIFSLGVGDDDKDDGDGDSDNKKNEIRGGINNSDDDDTDGADMDENEQHKNDSFHFTTQTSQPPKSSCCPFQKLNLHPNLISALTSPTGYFRLTQPTVVQSRAILSLLPYARKQTKKTKNVCLGKLEENLFIQSETGSGKTLAYLLPIVQVR